MVLVAIEVFGPAAFSTFSNAYNMHVNARPLRKAAAEQNTQQNP